MKDWMKDVPDVVWFLLEDWGYFKTDINLTDAVRVAKILVDRYCQQLFEKFIYVELNECLHFIAKWEEHATQQGELEKL